MIFKQVQEIIEGKKTQTRRVVKDGEELIVRDGVKTVAIATWRGDHVAPDYRIKWQVGRKYAVQPGRGMSQVYYRHYGKLELAHEHKSSSILDSGRYKTDLEDAQIIVEDTNYVLESWGYQPLYIQITGIRCEPLQDISEEDALVEGVLMVNAQILGHHFCVGFNYLTNQWLHWHEDQSARGSYRTLWESINGQKSWDANPEVWVLEFVVVTA